MVASGVPTQIHQERRVIGVVACFVVFALFLFLWGIGRIPTFGLDEKPYVNSARFLVEDTAEWLPIHPPLGKSLIAAGIKFEGDNARGWRIASAVAGSLTLGAIMLLTYVLVGSVEYTAIAGLLTLFDNFLFVMSRTATLDTFLMLFLFWGYLFFLIGVTTNASRRTRAICLMLSGILLGLGAACKWNALFSIAALLMIGTIVYVRQRNFSFPLLLGSFTVLPATAYTVTFLPLFRYMGKPFTLWNLAVMQSEMYHFMKALTGNGYIAIPWFAWPFQIAPQRGLMYLVGNHAVMFGGLVALGVSGWRLVGRFAVPELTIVTLYVVNLTQWVVIPLKFGYYYYYYPCALLLGIALVLALFRWQRKHIFGVRVSLIPVFAAIVIFLFCYPHMASLGAPWDTVLGYWI